jgi:flagellar hook-associated protein 3 FlgL
MTVASISSATVSSILQNTVTRLQQQLTVASSESSTGVLADIGQTLGADAGADVVLHQQMADLNAIQTSNAVVTAQLSTASDALASLQSAAASLLSQVIEGQSVTSGSTGAVAIQQAASAALENFATTMNASESGVSVFGGINTGTAPIAAYAQTPASAAQTAVENAFQSAFGFSIDSASVGSITGAQMTAFLNGPFAALFSGANWTSAWSSASDTAVSNRIGANQTVTTSITANQPAFQHLAQGLTMISAFAGLDLSTGAYTSLMSTAQSVMSTANNQLIEANAAVGTMQNQVNQANSAIGLQQNVLNTRIDANEAVNSYDVASQVSNLTTQLQTAYSLTAQIHKLSLVNFL